MRGPTNAVIQVVAAWLLKNSGKLFSMDTLAEDLAVARSTAGKAVLRLIRGGVVERLSGCRGNGKRTSVKVTNKATLASIASGKTLPPPTSLLLGTGTKREGTKTRKKPGWVWSLHCSDFEGAEAIRAAYGRTVAAGLIEQSEASLMRFAAAIARAQRVARNACAFVASFVRGKVPWSFLCAADEDAGRRMIQLAAEVPGYVMTVVSGLASRALDRLRAAVMPNQTPKPPMTMSANVPDPAPTPDTIGRHVWCYLMDGKTLSYAAEQAGVPADQAIAAVRRHAEKHGPDHVRRLENYLKATEPRALKRERVQQ